MSASCSWCRLFLPFVVVLAALSCLVCAESAVPAVKVSPRRNHWAVGHLMGKKSINNDEVLEHDGEYLRFVPGLERDSLLQKRSLRHRTVQSRTLLRSDIYSLLRQITSLL